MLKIQFWLNNNAAMTCSRKTSESEREEEKTLKSGKYRRVNTQCVRRHLSVTAKYIQQMSHCTAGDLKTVSLNSSEAPRQS